jgi:tetratricopeptide (TPR) repeat protein
VAASHWSQKRLDKSVPLFEEVLRLQENKLGREDPSTQGTVANLGVNYKDAGRLKEAVALLEEAYRASKQHAGLHWVGTPLMDAYIKAGQSAEAKKLFTELLGEVRNTMPKNSLQTADQLARLASCLLEMKEHAEAETLLREALAVREKSKTDEWRTFSIKSQLGRALMGQKKHADAEPLLLGGYDGLKANEKTIPPQAADRIPQALDRLIELYTATNKPEEAKKYKELRANYPAAKEPAPPSREKT